MLERRREYLSLVECYKTVFELNGLECRDYFEYCNYCLFKIRTKSAEVDAFKHSFLLFIGRRPFNRDNLWVLRFRIG